MRYDAIAYALLYDLSTFARAEQQVVYVENNHAHPLIR